MVTGGQERSDPGIITARGRVALAAGAGARWASRVTGRGAGAMIGGLVAMTLDRSILGQLGAGRRTVVVTGTNGKSTTTRMTAAALGTLGSVATNAEGANMDAGLVAAGRSPRRFVGGARGRRDARAARRRCGRSFGDRAAEPVARSARPGRRDQPHRTHAAGGLARHPSTVVVANCDDVLMTSAAYDSPNVVWVAAGGGWPGDSVSCPRSGEIIVRERTHWYSRHRFQAAQPAVVVDDRTSMGPTGSLPMQLALPGTVNRATPAGRRRGGGLGRRSRRRRCRVSTRSPAGTAPSGWVRTPPACCWPRIPRAGRRRCRWWTSTAQGGDRGQRAGARRRGPVLAVGCRFEHFEDTAVVAAGERGTDLAVRLGYAGSTTRWYTVAAIASCPPGHVEVIANYTAFLQLNLGASCGDPGPWLTRRCASGWCCPT